MNFAFINFFFMFDLLMMALKQLQSRFLAI